MGIRIEGAFCANGINGIVWTFFGCIFWAHKHSYGIDFTLRDTGTIRAVRNFVIFFISDHLQLAIESKELIRWNLTNVQIWQRIGEVWKTFTYIYPSQTFWHPMQDLINQILIETNLLDTSIIRVQLIHKFSKLFQTKTNYHIQLKEIFGQRPKDFMVYAPLNWNVLLNVHQN